MRGSDVVCELYISLTRQFFLRVYQREEMRCAVRDAAKPRLILRESIIHPLVSHRADLCFTLIHRFVASFVAFLNLTNDECMWTFLCTEVGAGHQEVSSFPSLLHKLLKNLSFDIYCSYAHSLMRLQPALHSTRKNIMNSHISVHSSPGSSLIVQCKVHRAKLQSLRRRLRSQRILQAIAQTPPPLSHISPRTLSPR